MHAMADYPDRPGYSFAPGLPPEASRFLRNKGIRPAFSFADVEPEEHAVAFTVAKAMELDVLAAIKAEVQKAIDEGLPLATFQKNFRSNPALAQWWGKREMVDPVTGEVELAQLGSPRRLKTIYNANLAAARAAGQWERIQRTKDMLPYLEYRLGASEHHRKHHADKEGLILPVDDAFWDDWMPRNGWGCNCWVRQITKREAERRGISARPKVRDTVVTNTRTGAVRIVPEGIDPAWARNPGKMRLENIEAVLAEKVGLLDHAAAQTATRDFLQSYHFSRFFEEGYEARLPVAVLGDGFSKAIGAASDIAMLDARTVRKLHAKHPEVTAEAFAALPEMIAKGTVQKQDATHLRILSRDPLPWVAVFEVLAEGEFLKLTTFFRFGKARWAKRMRSDFEVLRK